MNRPFICKPYGKDYLWGGGRLREEFAKNDLNVEEVSPLAESWECSTHPEGPSGAANGEYAGMELSDILRKHPEYLGSHAAKTGGSGENGQLPVLVKLLDAKQALSVQVHPDDDYAKEFENGQSGKSELWYILDAAKGSGIVYGLRRSAEKETLRKAAEDGTLEKYLQKVPVKKDQVFFVKAGTIHAVGAGCLIAEIQENSNLTYRLYDYDRIDKDGRRRPLHIEKALDAADLTVEKEPRQPLRVLRYTPGCARELLGRCRHFGCLIAEIQENSNLTYRLYDYDRIDKDGRRRPLHIEKALDAADLTVEKEPRQPLRVLRYTPGCARELLGRCRHFEVYRMLVNTERKQNVEFKSDELSFRVLLCIDGCGMLFFEDTMLEVYKGDCVFVPADSVPIRIHGKMQFLDVRC